MHFLDLIRRTPLPFNGERAAELLSSVLRSSAGDAVATTLAEPAGRLFLEGVFDGSPFLGHAANSSPETLRAVLTAGPDAAFSELMLDFRSVETAPNLKSAMSQLRQARLRSALTIGLADLSGAWSTMQATRALSDAASAAIEAGLQWALKDAEKRDILTLPDNPKEHGLIILGMGKLGANELNYSSDIDLIILYDPDRLGLRRPDRTQHEMTRLTRSLVQLLDERTADGYVHRTDLRLRPDPASTPPAISIQAAEAYYESMGQNWERAAMIKARPIAGDIGAGEQFLAELRPFIWRRSLDFNAIRDIQSIKRQIDRREGDVAPSAYEHNVKLGRGGIREIEFFVQTQQLIWGGRDSTLRSRETLQALADLMEAGHVTPDVAKMMHDAYLKLRDIEHRLQMVDDRQTHTTPNVQDAPPFARFAGYQDNDEFAVDLSKALSAVEKHFGGLFAEVPALSGGRALSFAGADDHPDTIQTIREMGYAAPENVVAAIRGWHHGRVRAARTQRAREILTEITPDILARFGATPDPDRAFAAFEDFVTGLPAGVQVFALLQANRSLLDFLARVLGRSPYLAALIGRRPHVLDAALAEGFMRPPGDKAELQHELDQELSDALDLQDRLDAARRWLNDLRLGLGVQTIEGLLRPLNAAFALSNAADIIVQAMLAGVRAEFQQAHGAIPDSAYAIIAYGKWGSQELTIGSDLDLVAVYSATDSAQSDGDRPLAASVYFMRLTQRLVTALTASTGEGRLFEVDMRLRPNGNDGPIATHIDGYRRYLEDSAWTWELMALSRARAAIGDPPLIEIVETLRLRALRDAPNRPNLLSDVAVMRQRVATVKQAGGPWDVRRRAGGLVDVEFVAQGLTLLHGANPLISKMRRPDDQLRALSDTIPDLLDILPSTARFWLESQWLLRLIGHDEAAGLEVGHPDIQRTMAQALGEADYRDLVTRRETVAAWVKDAYDHALGGHAVADSDT